jgi:uncharacterized protein (TIRG00374 family)
MFLTTVIGQSVIRWHISTKNQEGRLKFIAVMFFERSSFLFALFFAVLISLSFVKNPAFKEIKNSILPLATAGLFGLSFYSLYLNCSFLYDSINRITSYLSKKFNSEIMMKFFESISIFSIYYKKKKIMVSGLCLAFVWHLLFLVRVYLLIISTEVSLSFIQLSWMASLVLLLQILPVTLNGIGLRETSYAYLFKIQNLPPEKGIFLGILLLSQMILMASIGGFLHLLSRE